jgi:hypothetical protein
MKLKHLIFPLKFVISQLFIFSFHHIERLFLCLYVMILLKFLFGVSYSHGVLLNVIRLSLYHRFDFLVLFLKKLSIFMF